MDALHRSVTAFTDLEKVIPDGSHQLFHRVVAAMHDLCFFILEAEKKGKPRELIEEAIQPARDIHSRSVFIKRLQEWPRKYPGDFETIEYLCDHENRSVYGTVEYFLEEYALNSAIAQQHRNKLLYQSELILDSVLCAHGPVKVLSLGCGGCRDILRIKKHLEQKDVDIVINDIDGDALELAKGRLQTLKGLQVVPGNIIQALRRVDKLGPFDLIVTGGLFDHMSDRHVSFFLKHAVGTLLKDEGALFFSNAVEGNPFRVWMEYLASWNLNYRSEGDIRHLLLAAGFPESSPQIRKDETTLTFFVQCKGIAPEDSGEEAATGSFAEGDRAVR